MSKEKMESSNSKEVLERMGIAATIIDLIVKNPRLKLATEGIDSMLSTEGLTESILKILNDPSLENKIQFMESLVQFHPVGAITYVIPQVLKLINEYTQAKSNGAVQKIIGSDNPIFENANQLFFEAANELNVKKAALALLAGAKVNVLGEGRNCLGFSAQVSVFQAAFMTNSALATFKDSMDFLSLLIHPNSVSYGKWIYSGINHWYGAQEKSVINFIAGVGSSLMSSAIAKQCTERVCEKLASGFGFFKEKTKDSMSHYTEVGFNPHYAHH